MHSMAAVSFLGFLVTVPSWAGEYLERQLAAKLVPGPVEYSVLLPDGYADLREPVPLLLWLHGGGGNRDFLKQMQRTFEEAWSKGTLPKVVVVTPSASRSLYMDYKDGSQKWESFLIGPFLEHVRATYKVKRTREGTLLSGISMGGLGSLRLAFKYPDMFGSLAALEPGVDPVIHWKDLQWRHRFWRSDELFESIFGKPFDPAYWEANNPATIAAVDPERLRKAKLGIYLEVGDEDGFGLDEATEFLHRVLRDNRILHEYHLVRGADHVGRTIPPRTSEALGFLGRMLNPPGPDPATEKLRQQLAPLKNRKK